MAAEPAINDMKQTEEGSVACEPAAICPARWWHRTSVHILLILAVGCAVYSGIISAPFVFDDYQCIILNPAISDFRFLSDMSILKDLSLEEDIHKNIVLRPVGYLTFAINHHLGGFNVVGYHLFNIVVHLLNALLVYLITRLTLETRTFSTDNFGVTHTNATRLVPLFTALLFVSHPLQTQSVTYITQRFTSLAALFFILSLALYIKSGLSQDRLRRAFFYTGSLIAACIAMKTKEIAFTLPLMILVYEFAFFSNSVKRRIAKLLPFMLTMLIIPITVIKLDALFSHVSDASVGQSMNLVNYNGVSRWDYLFTQFTVIVTYIRLLLLPINQHLDYHVPLYNSLLQTPVALSLLLIAALMGIGIYLLYRSKIAEEQDRIPIRLIAFGILWFFITLSVESSLVPLDDLLVEQRVYLPSIGFLLAIVTSGAVILEHRKLAGGAIFAALFGLLVISLSTVTYTRNTLWMDPIALWQDSARKSPQRVRPYLNMGAHYFIKRMFQESLTTLIAGQRIDPGNLQVTINLADIYYALNRYNEAESEYLKAINAHPNNEQPYNKLAHLYVMRNEHSSALPLLQQVVRMNPSSPAVHTKLAELYEAMEQREQAVSEYLAVLQLIPEDPVIINRINMLNGR